MSGELIWLCGRLKSFLMSSVEHLSGHRTPSDVKALDRSFHTENVRTTVSKNNPISVQTMHKGEIRKRGRLSQGSVARIYLHTPAEPHLLPYPVHRGSQGMAAALCAGYWMQRGAVRNLVGNGYLLLKALLLLLDIFGLQWCSPLSLSVLP